MSRRRRKKEPRPNSSSADTLHGSERETVPWYKRAWVILSGVLAVVSAVFLSGPEALRNLRILPQEISTTISQFRSWVNEDEEWTGHWTAHPEIYADVADLQLSDVDMQITLWAKEGRLDGTIATKNICKSLPIVNYVFLEGSVSGDSARVKAWDTIGGHRVDFADLLLERDGHLMTVTPTAGRTDWFSATARLAVDPVSSDDRDQMDSAHTFCAEERAALFDRLRQQGDDK